MQAEAPQEGVTQLGYNAVEARGRRQPPRTKVTAESVQLPKGKRAALNATVQDQQRNIATLAWMVRMHLDYVSSFKFGFRSENEKLDKLVNRLFKWHARPSNFDIAGRLGRDESFRMFENEKTINGDALFIKIDKEWKTQAIESDMITYPKSGKIGSNNRARPLPNAVKDNVGQNTGVVLSRTMAGRVVKYCICNRGPDGKSVVYDHLEDAVNCIFDAYYTRFSSQVRGVSPLTTAINSVQDTVESKEWNILKAKAHAIFGVAIMREYYGGSSKEEEDLGLGMASGVGETNSDINCSSSVGNCDNVNQAESALQDLNPDQMLMLDLNPNDKISMIESSTPSNEFQDFVKLLTREFLLALDIPYSMYDSTGSTFASRIADTNLYEVAARNKITKNRWKRHEYSDWLLQLAWDSKEWNLRKVAEEAGFSRLREVQEIVKWNPFGVPWLQKLAEIDGDARAIEIGQGNYIDAAARRGENFFENIDKNKIALAYAEANGVSLIMGAPGARSVEEIENSEDETSDDVNTGDESNE